MKKISTEKYSILLSSIFTLLIFLIIFCTNFLNFNNNKINFSSSKMGKENLLQIKIIPTKENKIYKKNFNIAKEEKKILTNTEEMNKNTHTDTSKENLIEQKEITGNGNYFGENFGTSKILIDDIIDKKIQENIFYPEKAKQRGIEGKIILSITISKEGELLNYELLSKNESKILTEASKKIIEEIFPIEEIKNHILTENLSTQITFLYKLK